MGNSNNGICKTNEKINLTEKIDKIDTVNEKRDNS